MAFDGQCNANVRLVRLAMDLCSPHAFTSAPSFNSATTSRSFVTKRSVCAVVPRVMRTQPSHPGSAERSRTNIPRCRIAATNSRCRSPILISTKFASLGHHRNTHPGEFLLQSHPPRLHLRNVVRDEAIVRKRLGQRRERDRIHAVRRRHPPHHRHLLTRSGENSDAQPRQSVRLGKRACHKQITQRANIAASPSGHGNSKYASSTSSAASGAALAIFSNCSREAIPPVGLFGLATAISLSQA